MIEFEIFDSIVWNSLFKILNIKLKLSNAYHMKINAQIEKTNKTLKDMLKMYMWNKLGTWEQYLCLIEFAYNAIWHSSILMNSFHVGYMEIIIYVMTLFLGL